MNWLKKDHPQGLIKVPLSRDLSDKQGESNVCSDAEKKVGFVSITTNVLMLSSALA